MSISDQIEQITGVILPSEVREYFENFPFGPHSYLVNEGYVYLPHQVLEDMRYFLTKGFFGRVWPAHHLILGGDNCATSCTLICIRPNWPFSWPSMRTSIAMEASSLSGGRNPLANG